MKKNTVLAVISSVAFGVLVSSCTSLSQPVERFSRATNYGDSKAVETLTNEFGSTDLQMIAETMVSSLLEDPILADKPVMTLGSVKNKTSEYIDTKSIMNSIQTQLVKSRKVKFARSADELDAGVAELQRQNQSGLYKEQSKAKVGNMTAAKYSLEGEIVSIVKQTEKSKDVFYKMTLKVYDVEEGTVEWQDEKEIRKTSKK